MVPITKKFMVAAGFRAQAVSSSLYFLQAFDFLCLNSELLRMLSAGSNRRPKGGLNNKNNHLT